MSLQRITARLQRIAFGVKNVGVKNAAVYAYHSRVTNRLATRLFRIGSKRAAYPLWWRPQTSDLSVYLQVFLRREYSCLDDVPKADLVVDCGANIGCSSLYFLTKYPEARLIAIEPDADNFAMLERNLAPFSNRTKLVRSGVWSHPCGLMLATDRFRDGRPWTRQVRECNEGETAQMTAVDIGSLLQDSGFKSISILKIDVEGAESAIFSSNYDSWIDRVENLVIELHGPECEDAFFRAVKDLPVTISTCEELTVCKRSSDD